MSRGYSDSGNASHGRRLSIAIRGQFLEAMSTSKVNRNLLSGFRALTSINSAKGSEGGVTIDARAISLDNARIVSHPNAEHTVQEFLDQVLSFEDMPHQFDLCVTFSWPPRFDRCKNTVRNAIYLPWEFGSLPKEWIPKLNDAVIDEVWTPASFVRDQYILDGVQEDKVKVIPNPIANVFFERGDAIAATGQQAKTAARANPPAAIAKLLCEGSGPNTFTFLYVGGLLPRKGIDILQKAYAAEFKRDVDDVCLVVLSSYHHMYDPAPLQNWDKSEVKKPRLKWTNSFISQEDLIDIIAYVDVYAAPYRSEGFGMPIVEAMALGTPVLVTGSGSSLDLTTPETAVLVKAQPAVCTILPCKDQSICVLGDGSHPSHCPPTVRQLSWFEPDIIDLQKKMRWSVQNTQELAKKADKAREFVKARFTTHAVADLITRDR